MSDQTNTGHLRLWCEGDDPRGFVCIRRGVILALIDVAEAAAAHMAELIA